MSQPPYGRCQLLLVSVGLLMPFYLYNARKRSLNFMEPEVTFVRSLNSCVLLRYTPWTAAVLARSPSRKEETEILILIVKK